MGGHRQVTTTTTITNSSTTPLLLLTTNTTTTITTTAYSTIMTRRPHRLKPFSLPTVLRFYPPSFCLASFSYYYYCSHRGFKWYRGSEVRHRWPHQYTDFLEQQCLALIQEKINRNANTATASTTSGVNGGADDGKDEEEEEELQFTIGS